MKHIQKGNNKCPTCKTPIASSNPLQYLAYDPKIQEITYKLVPNLYKGNILILQFFEIVDLRIVLI